MLNKDKVKEYWENRSDKYGARTVGFNNTNIEEQDLRYEERYNFIIPKLSDNYKTLDYGCGIGRYAGKFENYEGYDITVNLLNIAKEQHPDKKFIHLEDIGVPINDCERFFTSAVLQHNSDETVEIIFNSVKNNMGKLKQIVLYENTFKAKDLAHIKFRTDDQYIKFVTNYFKCVNISKYHHIIHGEDHSLLIFDI